MDSAPRGLSQAEAEKRLRANGANELPRHRNRWFALALRQVKDPFVLLLVAAAILSLGLGNSIEAGLILAFVVINIGIGFVQEARSQKALDMLQAYTRPYSHVLRDGEWRKVSSRELVAGDIIRLGSGDIVPADAEIRITHSLEVDESILTGESAPASKSVNDALFSGTHIVQGQATAEITDTGAKTSLGKTATLATESPRPSEFERGISNFATFILKMVGVTLVVVLLANLAIKGERADLGELIVFSIALAVSVIPEALPLVMSLSMSNGALKLARQNVVVRRLSAVEAAGSIDVLCTDKTGTLTENKMTVADIFGDRRTVIQHASLGSRDLIESDELPENPFDSALYHAQSSPERRAVRKSKLLAERPFDPERRLNSAIVELNGTRILIVRGAPEAVGTNESHKEWIEARGAEGCRILAIAAKTLANETVITNELEKNGLEIVGLIAYKDPVKADAAEAVRTAERLGVRVIMLTGDAPDVAAAVGHEVGLLKGHGHVYTGTEYEAMDQDEKNEAVKIGSVFARVKPEQKHDIIRRLQKTHDVGFLGEGINDAPALAAANVGFVVQHASDIARESADIILLDKSLSVIMNGIRLGRETFANTATYIKATLTSNFGNFYAIAISTLFIEQIPLLPAQILLVNLLTDAPMIAISTDAVDPEELRKPKKYDVREIVLLAIMLGLVSTVFDFIFFALFRNGPIEILRTNWFIGSVLTELVLILSIRTRLPFWKARTLSPLLFWLTLIAAVACVLIPISSISTTLGFVQPSGSHLRIILLVVACYFIMTETIKLFAVRAAKRET
ncbi:cation-transporting P-type ATPase [Candidatus Uhrbacteria bacterium]|nr:cation-transporting P-type ATPase [Candidatus Uhrbacteria bacterium]